MDLYPAAPADIPADLARPRRAYRWHAWLAAFALALFVVLYLGLTLRFGAFGLRLLRDAAAVESRDAFGSVLLSLPAWFFFAFLVSGLFFVKRPQLGLQREITERDEPELFAFLHRVAADVRAPRPHRVFLTPGVNAGVYYDLSILNLIYPSRKNLEIGLGLVNALTLSELKAVIAHEFGHFGQDMMALGRWVYVAEQIAARIVTERGVFDRILRALERSDLRFIVIAWPMALLIWAMRAVLDTAFAGVALALRALLREMELQADLVAVTVSGSDCLVHALHKLQAADDAYDRALAIVGAELAQGRPVQDLFALQSRAIEKIRAITDDPHYGAAPALPETGRESHRIFSQRFAQPARMWATHPPSREREDNAKRRYVASTFDDRPAWILFADPAATRKQLTRTLLEAGSRGVLPPAVSLSSSLQQVDRRFDRVFFDRRYRGAYLHRPIASYARHVRELYDEDPPAADGVEQGLATLYPAALSQDLERWRELARERATLEAIQEGSLTTSRRGLVHRGRKIRRSALSGAIAEVGAELDLAKARVLAHDRACRTLHLAAAARLGRGWPEYLVGLLGLLHYAEHSADDLEDMAGQLRHVLALASANRRISGYEIARLVKVGRELHGVVSSLVGQSQHVMVSKPVAQRLGIKAWAGYLPQQLPPLPAEQNLQGWLSGVDRWINAELAPLRNLASATLETLLESEAHVANCLREGRDPGEAPGVPRVPSSYALRSPGSERKRQQLDPWVRLQTARGLVPRLLHSVAACAVLAPVLLHSVEAPRATVTLVNGLGVPVRTSIGDVSVDVDSRAHASIRVRPDKAVAIRTFTALGNVLIEEFAENLDNASAQYVYNIASATPLVEWTATYGRVAARPPRILGAPLWLTCKADILFDSPPQTLQSSTDGGTRVVLESGSRRQPLEQLAMVGDEDSAKQLLQTHVRWERPLGNAWYGWLWAGQTLPGFQELLGPLLGAWPKDATLRVIEYESAGDPQRQSELCAGAQQRRREAPDDPDARFLVARCIANPEQRSQAVLEAYQARPEHGWTALAAGMSFVQLGERGEAEQALSYVKRQLPFMAPVLEQAIRARWPEGSRQRGSGARNRKESSSFR